MGALGDPYVDLPHMKEYTTIPTANTRLDDILTSALQSASDQIELHCDRQFNRAEATSARVYTSKTPYSVRVDDFWSTEGLIIEIDSNNDDSWITVLDAVDYELLPRNGVVAGQVGWPYDRIRLYANRGNTFGWGCYNYRVRVTAKWGWAAVPDNVKQATMLLANETFAAKGAPLGVAGSNAFGDIRVRQGMLWKDKIQRYVRTELLVG